MSDSWMVQVGGKGYGPYTTTQMEAFVAEGRITPSSLIARNGETDFHSASEEPEFAMLFQLPINGPSAHAESMRPEEPVAAQKFGRSDTDSKAGERARFIVIADMKSRSIQGVEEELFKMGPTYSIMPQVWLLVSELSVTTIRNLLMQQLGKLDVLFVVDSTHDKAAWFNFGPETDTRIRKLWLTEIASKLAFG